MTETRTASAVFGTPADLRRGLAGALIVGIASAIRTFIHASRSVFAYRHGDPVIVAGACFGGALVAGILFGVLRPVTRKLPIASAIAFVGGFPIVVAEDATRNTPTHPPGTIRWLFDIGFTIVFAVGAALLYRRWTADQARDR